MCERKIIRPALAALVVLGLALAANAETILVRHDGSGDQPNIQAGIGAATAGDTVLLAPGTYSGTGNCGINFLGRAITVTSQEGAETTILECGGATRGIVFNFGEGPDSKLSGVTILNAYGDGAGGGVRCDQSSPTITDCVFRDCNALQGGGIGCVSGANPLISGCEFLNCQAQLSQGGAIYIVRCSPEIAACLFSANTADVGGGIYVGGEGGIAAPNIHDNEFLDNIGVQKGGGIAIYVAEPTIRHNVLSGNSSALGGGIHFQSVLAAVVENNTIAENSGTDASAIAFVNSTLSVDNSIVAFNTGGQAVVCSGGDPAMDCCISWGNEGGDELCSTNRFHMLEDPQFCGVPDSRNFYLQSDSPGSPDSPKNLCPGSLIGSKPVFCGITAARAATWGEVKSLYR